MARLTESLIESLAVKPGKRDRMVFDTVCPGLGVRVTTKGSKIFVAQWTDPATKRKQREPLGVWGGITLTQARTAARARLGSVAAGVNPRSERLKAKVADERARAEAALTFDALISDWAALHLASRRARYAAEAERAIRLAFADIISKPAALITKAEITNRLDALMKVGKVTTAGRTMAYARAAFSWALKRGKVSANPFAGLPMTAPTNERERMLTEHEVHEVWSVAGAMSKPIGAFVKIALLTLARRDEVAGMCWSEISLDHAEWVIPGARTKNSRPHTVHLSTATLEVLETVERVKGQDLVFSTTGKTPISGFSRFKEALDAAIVAKRAEVAERRGEPANPLAPFVLHDFRRTGVSTLAALGFDSIVADKLLNHQPAKLRGVASVYQRHEFGPERARALDAWANYCTGTLAETDNIRRFRGAA
jgi:integrase